mgnify:FL=1
MKIFSTYLFEKDVDAAMLFGKMVTGKRLQGETTPKVMRKIKKVSGLEMKVANRLKIYSQVTNL